MVLENDAGTRRTTTMEERRGFIRMLITVAVVALAVGAARAADDTTGKVTIESISAAAGLGFTWGTGVLEYRGQQYPFMVKGFSVVDVGVSQRVARGEVYNLKSAEDFEGTFAADSGHPGGRLPQPVVAGGRSTVWPVAMVTPSGSTLDRRPGDVAGTS